MSLSDYIIIVLIFLGAIVMLMSTAYTKKIFTILPDSKLKSNWKKLRLLMFVFFIGYIFALIVVLYGKTELLALLSGVIFFMGSLFVFIVVGAGLDSFKKLKELNQNLDDTQIKNEELEQFAHITSHDLKTPIRGISSLASFIKQDIASGQMDEVDSYLSTIQLQVERLENLINGILNYSKIGKVSLVKVDLNTLLQEEITHYKHLKNVKIKIQGQLPVLYGDKIQLTQVVSNLISNAIKYNDKKICEVWVSSIEELNKFNIIFEDNGPGIDEKYHQKVFDVFQTFNNNDTYESTGIGLAIVKKVIEKHEGTIKVVSNDGDGVKFIITYPKVLNR